MPSEIQLPTNWRVSINPSGMTSTVGVLGGNNVGIRSGFISRPLRRPLTVAQAQAGMRIKDMGARMKDMRASMDESEDERLKALMSGLRGQNIDDSDFAGSGVRMNLVEIARGDEDEEELPLTYDPEAIAAYWDRRPVSIITRILQLLGK